jgi:GTP-binding protein
VSSPLSLEFVMSATRVADLPPTDGEIAVVGRSNVGKSSLINALANRKALAKVSKTPGRTQLLNLFEFGDGTTLMDLPGYGYAKVPGHVRATWGPMIEGYLLGRDHLTTVLGLVDAEVGPTPIDVNTLEWLAANDLPVRVVATKHDKVKSSKRDKRKKELAERCGMSTKDILWVSASSGVNVAELRGRILEWVRPPTE